MAAISIEGRRSPSRAPLHLIVALAIILYGIIDFLSTSNRQPLFGALAEGDAFFTETELRAFDGTNDDKTIYVAIDGIVFDVSESPAFYGPGGHYHHFTGKDASRAWVTECWDEPTQLTWRMDGSEDMFMPKYLDEMIEGSSDGKGFSEDDDIMGPESMKNMAKLIMKKLGKVTEYQKKERRKEDKLEAKEAVDNQLAHWVDFFRNNPKYKVVGYVVHDKDKPEPPAICEAAFKKRPLKYGKLDGVMNLGNNPNNRKVNPEVPDFIKQKIKEKGGTGDPAVAEEEEVKDEL